MQNAILYARVSTAEQAKQQYNLPAQEAKLRDYCDRNELHALKLFVERGESDRTADRKEFQAMMDFCRKNRGKVNVLVVADLSRLARNVLDQGTTIATLTQLGIELVSGDEPIRDHTPAGNIAPDTPSAMNQG